MSKSKQFAAFALAATTATALLAESRCPGNVESLPYRSLNRHQIVISVSVNHSGPYNFLLDTGTQMTMIDPALAGELHLIGSGAVLMRSAGVRGSASAAEVDLVEAGISSGDGSEGGGVRPWNPAGKIARRAWDFGAGFLGLLRSADRQRA